MMPPILPPSYPRAMKALSSLLSAHTAIREGIADHAQKHEAAVDAKRRKLEEDAKVNAGIEAANAKVPGNPQVR